MSQVQASMRENVRQALIDLKSKTADIEEQAGPDSIYTPPLVPESSSSS